MTNWTRRDNILRGILNRNNDPDNEVVSVASTKKELIPHLQISPLYKLLSPHVIRAMEQATTFHSFNQTLDKVFDYADDNRIWIEL